MKKRLCFTIDGKAYHAVLQEHPLAEQISALCPFTLKYTRNSEQEYYASLPKKATAKGCPSTTKGQRNGLYYFEGWNALSLVFCDCDTAPFQIHPLGNFEEDISAVLEQGGRSLHILCEAE